jgi:hypothetical protein
MNPSKQVKTPVADLLDATAAAKALLQSYSAGDFASSAHTHILSDVDELVDALASKYDSSHVGTTANKLVQLTAAAKLPAVDGSLLTDVVPASHTQAVATLSDASSDARAFLQAADNAAMRTALEAADKFVLNNERKNYTTSTDGQKVPVPYVDDFDRLRCEKPLNIKGQYYAYDGQFTTKAATASFRARDGAQCVYLGSDAYLLGGWNGSSDADWDTASTTNEVWKSTNDGTSWTRILTHDSTPASTQFTRRHTFGAIVKSSYIYVMGSDVFDSSFPTGNSACYRSSDGVTWSQQCAHGSPGWDGKVLVMFGKLGANFYAIGGQTDLDDPTTADAEVWRSTDDCVTWTQLSNAPFSGRGTVSQLAEFDNKLWVVCGGRYSNDSTERAYFNGVYSFDGTTWTEVLADGNDQLPAMMYPTMFTYDAKLWISRGVTANGQNSNSLFWTDGTGEQWRRVSSTIEESHADGTAVGPNGVLFASGNYMIADSVSPVRLMTAPVTNYKEVIVEDDKITLVSNNGEATIEQSGSTTTIDVIATFDIKVAGVLKARLNATQTVLAGLAVGDIDVFYSAITHHQGFAEMRINNNYPGDATYGGWVFSNGSSVQRLKIRGDGSLELPTLTDAAAANNSLYYSSTAGKLVYKDSGGTVNNLY